MYRIVLTVVEMLDIYDVHASLWETDDNGETVLVATQHDSIPSVAYPLSSDSFASIITALREWSFRTIQD
jgi:hypothetical protein